MQFANSHFWFCELASHLIRCKVPLSCWLALIIFGRYTKRQHLHQHSYSGHPWLSYVTRPPGHGCISFVHHPALVKNSLCWGDCVIRARSGFCHLGTISAIWQRSADALIHLKSWTLAGDQQMPIQIPMCQYRCKRGYSNASHPHWISGSLREDLQAMQLCHSISKSPIGWTCSSYKNNIVAELG